MSAFLRGALLLLLFFIGSAVCSQTITPCTTPGQTPSTAFPVCGTATFSQESVPLCGGRRMAYKNCGNDLLTDINPFWYKFTCFQSGTLGFTITPNNLSSDYDWEVYDITGRNPDDVFTEANLVIANNWSGETGLTGASSTGTQLFVCGGVGKPLYSQMPQLIAGRDYLLLVSHFTPSQSGYKLSFGGGTAVITDNTTPHLKMVDASCGGDILRLKLNKRMKCSSIAANGSDFFVMPGNVPVQSSTGIGCTSQFDTDSLELKLPATLQPGNYTLHIKKGTDNNTILDYCDRQVPESETLNFTVFPKAPTPMDSIGKLSCKPNQVRVYFRKPVQCASIASNGSDFAVNGTYPVAVTGASGSCVNGVTKEVLVTFAAPLQTAGNFQLVLQRGTDGNTVLDECSEETPPGSALPFSVKDTVNASFVYSVRYGCERDTVVLSHNGANGVNSWKWDLDDAGSSTLQNPAAIYTVFDQKTISLVVSNGFCTDSSEQTVVLDNFLKADFSVVEDNCPNEPITFTSSAEGRIVAHTWAFGDGATAVIKDPTHTYTGPGQQTTFPVRYTVLDQYGCSKTAVKNVTIYTSCFLTLPNAFTPNADGKNDVFRVMNAVKAEDLEFTVFNRWGQVVFRTKNWRQGWDGKLDGNPQPTGTYVWLLRYIQRDTKKRMEQKGTVTLIR